MSCSIHLLKTVLCSAGFQPGYFSKLFIEQGFLTPNMQLVEGCPPELLSAKINKLILLSSLWQTSLHIVRDLHMHFEPINISIALHRPVKHLKTSRVSLSPADVGGT